MPDYSNLPDSTSITIEALNEGVWGDNLRIHLHSFDDEDNTYRIDVYLRENGYDHLKEEWYVSNSYQLDGFGKQMHAESKINDESQLIKVTINLHESAHPMPLHRIYEEEIVFVGFLQKVFESNQFSLVPGSVVIQSNAPGELKMFDNGKGTLSGPAGSGIINYETGAYQIALAFGTAAFATYDYDSYLSLSGGADGDLPNEDEIISLIEQIQEDELEFELAIETQYQSEAIQRALTTLSSAKGYSIAVLNVPDFETAQEFIEWRNLHSIDSSYACYVHPPLLVRNPDAVVQLPAAPFVAANMAYVASEVGPGIPVAGEITGLLTCIGAAKELDESIKELMFDNHINYIESNDISGATLMSEFTAQVYHSPVSRISVRRIMNTVRRVLEMFSETLKWKVNSSELRKYITQSLNTNFAILKQTSNLQGFLVTCDGTNNSESDSEEVLRIDVTIVPMDSNLRIKWSIALDQSGNSNISNSL